MTERAMANELPAGSTPTEGTGPDEIVSRDRTRETMTGEATSERSAATAAADHGQLARIVMYSTPWCGYCRRLKDQLARAGIAVTEVDIEQDPRAAELVMRVNDGNQTVPTLVFADGSALANPSVAQVTERLAAQR